MKNFLTNLAIKYLVANGYSFIERKYASEESFVESNSLGERILFIRKKMNKTQAEFSQLFGYYDISISCKWESNNRTPRLDTLEKMAKLSGVSLDWLTTGKSETCAIIIEDTPNPSIGERLRIFAWKKWGGHGSLKKLADSLGVNPTHLTPYLNNVSEPGSKTLIKLNKLGCDINWLLTGKAV